MQNKKKQIKQDCKKINKKLKNRKSNEGENKKNKTILHHTLEPFEGTGQKKTKKNVIKRKNK